MSVFLVGGAFDPATAPGLLEPFVAEATLRAGGRPRVAVLLLDQGRMAEFLPSYVAGLADADVLPVRLDAEEPVPAATVAELARADGILVGGGWTPGYHRAMADGSSLVAETIWSRVHGGTPYAGFSAGAMVAGDLALLGGYLSGGREVCEEGCSEGLDDLTVRPGLGLVPFTSEVHVTGGGTLGRGLELVTAGLVESVAAIDEDTCLTVAPGGAAADGVVTGAGSVWLVRAGAWGDAVVRRVSG